MNQHLSKNAGITDKPLVSVIIPARNEEETIGPVLKDLLGIVQILDRYAFEILVVDDHSTDRTAIIAREHGVAVVFNAKTPGKGMALIAGFEQAKGDYIIMLDADGSHRCEEIPVFLQLMQDGFGLVVGSRWTGGSEEYTLVRGFGNVFLTGLFWIVTGHLITDALNGFKSFHRELIDHHDWKCADFEIEIELLIAALKLNYKIGEFSSYELARAGGLMKSSVIRHGWKFFLAILRLGIPYRWRSLRTQCGGSLKNGR